MRDMPPARGIASTVPSNPLPESGDTLHRAGRVIVDPWTVLENGYVQVCKGELVAVGKGRGPKTVDTVIDHGPGALLPGLVNAHTHLELSALKGKTVLGLGVVPWVESVLRLREETPTEDMIDAADAGFSEIEETGTALIGEIATAGITRSLFEERALGGVWFQEYLGSGIESEPANRGVDRTDTAEKRFSVAGHAPHTTAPDFLVRLKQAAVRVNRPFGIHLAESAVEVEFLETGKGTWVDFLDQRGIDWRSWRVSGSRPVPLCDRLGLLDSGTLAVHLIECNGAELDLLAERGVSVCVCPRSNMLLHGKTADIPAMLAAGIRPCLGTDSLASNVSLNLFDEMRFMARTFPSVSPEEILAMATLNGARALGFGSRYGRIARGASGRFFYMPTDGCGLKGVVERIVNEKGKVTIIGNKSRENGFA